MPRDSSSGDAYERVLVVAPFGGDARLLGATLGRVGIESRPCDGPEDLPASIELASGAVILSQEGMTQAFLDRLSDALRRQPSWSEMPVVAVLDHSAHNEATYRLLRERLAGSNLTFLQRPVRTIELVSAVQTALRARRRQIEVRDHLLWQQEMQGELVHRVKNILASVSAIFQMSRRQATSIEDLSEAFSARLDALTRVHGAAPGDSLRTFGEVARVVLAPYDGGSEGRIARTGPAVPLTPGAVTTISLCLHELATNAAKYGALSAEGGRVALTWAVDGDRLAVDWTESGGPAVARPSREGYGTRFLQSAVGGALRGEVRRDWGPGGLACRLVLPLSQVSPVEGQST